MTGTTSSTVACRPTNSRAASRASRPIVAFEISEDGRLDRTGTHDVGSHAVFGPCMSRNAFREHDDGLLRRVIRHRGVLVRTPAFDRLRVQCREKAGQCVLPLLPSQSSRRTHRDDRAAASHQGQHPLNHQPSTEVIDREDVHGGIGSGYARDVGENVPIRADSAEQSSDFGWVGEIAVRVVRRWSFVPPPIHRQDVVAAAVKVGGGRSTDPGCCPDNDDAAWISNHRSLTLSNAW